MSQRQPTQTPHTSRSLHRGALAGVTALLLAAGGCTADQAAAATAETATRTVKSSLLVADQLPDCPQVAAAVGSLVSDWVLTPSDGSNGVEPDGTFDAGDSYGVSCTWFTKNALSSDLEMMKEGGFGITISVDRSHPQKEEDLRSVDLVFDDPRAQAIGGFVIGEPTMALDEQIKMPGPEVVVGNIRVGTISVGLALQKIEAHRRITNDRAIDAAVAVHKILR